jgi:predicted metal-binding protein
MNFISVAFTSYPSKITQSTSIFRGSLDPEDGGNALLRNAGILAQHLDGVATQKNSNCKGKSKGKVVPVIFFN